MSIVLAPLVLVLIFDMAERELLQRNTLKHDLNLTPYRFGLIIGHALWRAYAWVTRLRYGIPDNPALHAIFMFLFVVSMLTYFLTVFSNPGICAMESKDGLKPIIEELVRGKCLDKFCIECRVVKLQHTQHCPHCNKCIMHGRIQPPHTPSAMNCINMKNYTYYVIFIFSYNASIFMFDYLVWKHLLALKDGSLPSRSCVLPDTVCKHILADMFLVSIAVGSLWGLL